MNEANNDPAAASRLKMKNVKRCFCVRFLWDIGSSIIKVEIARKMGNRHASHIDQPCITKGLPCLDGIDNEPVYAPYRP